MTEQGVQPDLSKVSLMLEWPMPEALTQLLHGLLGLQH